MRPGLLHVDPWTGSFQRLDVRRTEDCPACVQGKFDFLTVRETSWVTTLCGRNAVQITPARQTAIALDTLSEALARVGPVTYNGLLLQFAAEGCELTIFPDGRVIVRRPPVPTRHRQHGHVHEHGREPARLRRDPPTAPCRVRR